MSEWQVNELGYVVFGISDVTAWRDFARNLLGSMVAEMSGGVYVRLDEYPFRVLIIPAELDGIVAAGWIVRNAASFAAGCAAIRGAGVDVVEGSSEDATLRQVRAFVRFVDPGGNSHELAWGRTVCKEPFLPVERDAVFLEGRDTGFGHVVLPSGNNFDANVAFWTDVCGLGLSDYTALVTPSAAIRIYFLHTVNARHHSLAIVEHASPAGIFHMMIEARDLNAVGRALDRVTMAGAPLARSLGKHVNDEVVSFYVAAPGGIMIEYGCGGRMIDPASHEVAHIPRGSHWGHLWQPDFDPRSQ